MRSQATGEFVVAFTLIMFIFMGVLVLLNEYLWNTDSQDIQDMEKFLDELQSRVELAILSEGSIRMSLTIPNTIGDREYNLSFRNDSGLGMTLVEVWYDDYDRIRVSRFIPLIRNNSDLNARGEYTLVKNTSGLYLLQ